MPRRPRTPALLAAGPVVGPVVTLVVGLVVGLVAGLLGPAAAAPAREGIQEKKVARALARVPAATGGLGAVVRVHHRGESFAAAAGSASLDPATDALPKARFRAASVTKQLTAVLALQEVARGRWSLDTTLGDVLPDLWPARSGTTLRQLLSMTSGIPEYLPYLAAEVETNEEFVELVSQRRTPTSLVDLVRDAPADAPVGTYSYSNTNFVLVGMMLEETTGARLTELMSRRILTPARMTRSVYPTTSLLPAPRLDEYGHLGEDRLDLRTFDPSTFAAAGALVSTARDLNRFQRALSSGELIPPRLVREMRAVQAVDEESGLRYGLGSYRIPDPCRPGRWLHGHDGGSYGTATVSFSNARGTRRVTAATSGRDLLEGSEQLPLAQVLQRGFAAACPGRDLGARADAGDPVPFADLAEGRPLRNR